MLHTYSGFVWLRYLVSLTYTIIVYALPSLVTIKTEASRLRRNIRSELLFISVIAGAREVHSVPRAINGRSDQQVQGHQYVFSRVLRKSETDYFCHLLSSSG